MTKVLRVGIIGANAGGGWAGEAHVPAVQGLAGLELAAIATSNRKTADEAAHAFGVGKAYADGRALIADPDIEIVTVATRVPDHRDLLLAAIAAGKHVYCEWPLGRSCAESHDLAKAAQTAKIHAAVGLQLRGSPVVKRARDIVASGSLGRILSVSTFSSTAGFGPEVAPPFAYLEDPGSFANLVTIQGAHTLDLLIAVAGTPLFMSALTSRQFPLIRIGGGKEARDRTTFDHMLLQGQLQAGAPFALEVAGGREAETPFHLDVVGENGRLRLEGGARRGLQSSRVGLSKNGERAIVPQGELEGLSDAAANVGGVYAALRDNILDGSQTVTNFNHAEKLTRLVEDIFTSSKNGSRLQGNCWPEA